MLSAAKFLQDLKYAIRTFGRSPGFVSVALLSLALGIGATTALFSVVYGVLIAPYPYASPERIWAPAVATPKETLRFWHPYTRAEFLELRKLPVFSQVMATDPSLALMTGDRAPENLQAIQMTGNAFDFLGVKPILGRTIEPFDIGPGGEPAPVAVMSYGFWQRVFGGQASAIGSKIVLDDVPHTLIGVMPPRFGWYTQTGVWVPMRMDAADERGVNAIVRLANGVSAQAAAASLHNLNLDFARRRPRHFPNGPFRTALLNYLDITVASGEMTSSLHVLLAAVGFLLLISCANVANLQLARTTTRFREIAMRLSIGASRGRIVRQLLTESVLLSVAGGVLGILLAIGLTRAIVALIPEFYVPGEARIAVNAPVLLFSFAISVCTGVLFGLAPAIQCTRPNLTDALKDGARGSGSSSAGGRMRNALVVAEIALSVILLAGASLAVRSFADLLRIDTGFRPERTLLVNVPLRPKQYKTIEQRNGFARGLLERVRSLPGIEAASIGSGGIVFGGPRSGYSLDGSAVESAHPLTVVMISAEYAQTMGIALKRGRMLTEDEVARGAHVALINQTAARLWPAGVDPLGRGLSLEMLANAGRSLLPASPSKGLTIAGILADTRNAGLRDKTEPAVFVPYTLVAPPSRVLAVRTRGEPLAMLNAIRGVVRTMDREVPIDRPITLEEILGQETAQPRFTMALLACFAALGIGLAAAGIYSVIACDVTQKAAEIGVRIALGASTGNVLSMVMGKSARMVGAGLAIGLAGSVALEKVVRFDVFGTAQLDWLSGVAVALALALVSMAASWLPARRAAAMNPVDALRREG